MIISHFPPKNNIFSKKSYIFLQINNFQKSYTDQAGVFPIINPSAHINYGQMDKTTRKTLCWSHMTTSYLSSQIVALTDQVVFLIKKDISPENPTKNRHTYTTYTTHAVSQPILPLNSYPKKAKMIQNVLMPLRSTNSFSGHFPCYVIS